MVLARTVFGGTKSHDASECGPEGISVWMQVLDSNKILGRRPKYIVALHYRKSFIDAEIRASFDPIGDHIRTSQLSTKPGAEQGPVVNRRGSPGHLERVKYITSIVYHHTEW